MKDIDLLKELEESNYDKDLKEYLRELIYISISPFHDLSKLNKIKLDKLEYEIIKYNLISKSIQSLADCSSISVKRNYNSFTIYSKGHNIIDILFLRKIRIYVYDMINTNKIYNSTLLEYFDLKNKISNSDNVYNSKEFKYLSNKINELESIDNDVIITSKNLNNELEIPDIKGNLVAYDNLYSTYEIYSNNKILLYKNKISK